MRVIVEQGETLFFDQQFSGGTIYIGRHEQCQVKLPPDHMVAPRHLMIFQENNQWFVNPLHDQYHTSYLNGHLLSGKQKLEPENEFMVSGYRIKCQIEPKSEEKAAEKTTIQDKGKIFEIIAKPAEIWRQTMNMTNDEMNIPRNVIVKSIMDSFSLSKGRIEYICALAMKMFDQPNVRNLITMVMDSLITDFQALRVWVGLRTDQEGHLHLAAGKDAYGKAIDAPSTAKRFSFGAVECARALLCQTMDKYPDRCCMASPLISPDGSLGMLYIEAESQKVRYTLADLDTLVFVCSQLALAINRLLIREQNQVTQIRSLDQELARKVQARAAPWQLPQWPGLQLGVLSEPGTGDCSDFYDVLPLGEKQVMFLVGKASMAASDTAISIAEMTSAFRIGAVHRDIPQALMRQINWLMYSTSAEPRRIDAGIIGIDPSTGEFVICLAGNVHAFIVGADGNVLKIKMAVANPFVGESRKSKYEAVKGRLSGDQSIAICTDGIFSIVTPQGNRFDEKHLSDILSDNYGQIPARSLGDLADEISSFTGGKKAQNDITLLLLRKAGIAG